MSDKSEISGRQEVEEDKPNAISASAKCAACGREYKRRSFVHDSGFCPEHGPNFFSAPIWFSRTQAGTQSIWQFTLIIHILYLIFFGTVLFDGGIVVTLYCLTVIAYLLFRLAWGAASKYPILNRFQVLAFLLLPIYGTPLWILLFQLGQMIKNSRS